jgi:predicted ester cyclase
MKNLVKTILETSSLFLIIALFFIAGCQQQKDYSKEYKPIIDKLVDAWNGRNIDSLDAIFAPDIERSVNNRPVTKGVEGYKKAIEGLRTAFPDVKLSFDNLVYGENSVALRWVLTGTNTGPGKMPPTGKHVNYWGESIEHIVNGKVTKEIIAFDNQEPMEQLGYTIMPPAPEKKK